MKFQIEYAKLRKASGLTQIDLQAELKKYNIQLTIPQLSRIENGHTLPTLQQFFALCEILHVQYPLDYFSDFHTSMLNNEGLRKLEDYADDLIASGRYKPVVRSGLRRPLYLLPASAGTGQFLDDAAYEMIDLPEDISEDADFAIRISGDSMEPRYHDGEYAWVKKQNTIENDQIGIFYLDGNSYIKKFSQNGNSIRLISLNPEYAPLEVNENSEFQIFGRVIS